MPVHVLFLMNFWSRYNIIYIWIETSQIRDLTFVKTCRQTTGILIVLKYFISFLSSVCWWVAGDEDKMWGSLQSDSHLNTMDRLGLHGGYHLLMINNSRSVNRNTSSDGPDSLEPVTTTGCILYSEFTELTISHSKISNENVSHLLITIQFWKVRDYSFILNIWGERNKTWRTFSSLVI